MLLTRLEDIRNPTTALFPALYASLTLSALILYLSAVVEEHPAIHVTTTVAALSVCLHHLTILAALWWRRFTHPALLADWPSTPLLTHKQWIKILNAITLFLVIEAYLFAFLIRFLVGAQESWMTYVTASLTAVECVALWIVFGFDYAVRGEEQYQEGNKEEGYQPLPEAMVW
jgi:hypothetical protein